MHVVFSTVPRTRFKLNGAKEKDNDDVDDDDDDGGGGGGGVLAVDGEECRVTCAKSQWNAFHLQQNV